MSPLCCMRLAIPLIPPDTLPVTSTPPTIEGKSAWSHQLPNPILQNSHKLGPILRLTMAGLVPRKAGLHLSYFSPPWKLSTSVICSHQVFFFPRSPFATAFISVLISPYLVYSKEHSCCWPIYFSIQCLWTSDIKFSCHGKTVIVYGPFSLLCYTQRRQHTLPADNGSKHPRTLINFCLLINNLQMVIP